jgi:hypothetical protein
MVLYLPIRFIRYLFKNRLKATPVVHFRTFYIVLLYIRYVLPPLKVVGGFVELFMWRHVVFVKIYCYILQTKT